MDQAKAKGGLTSRWRALARGATLAGWGCVVTFALAFAFEVSGLPERLVARALSDQLGPAAGQVRVEDVELSWIRRSALLRGLTLGTEQEDLRVEELDVRLDWRHGRGIIIESAEVRRADLRISHALVTGLEGLLETRKEEAPPELPELVVRGLSIAVETPEYGDLAVGELDLAPPYIGQHIGQE